MDPSDFEWLSKRLNGYRVRRDKQIWSIKAVTLSSEGRLSLQIIGAAIRTLSIDLPAEFNAHDNEHIAWLLGWIEHTLLNSP